MKFIKNQGVNMLLTTSLLDTIKRKIIYIILSILFNIIL